MAETWSGEFYCVKCKEKRRPTERSGSTTRALGWHKAICPVCGTNLNRILGKA